MLLNPTQIWHVRREDPSDTTEDDPTSSIPVVNAVLKSGYVAKVFCGEEDNSIRVTPVQL